jgi:hypothetical protein
MMGVSESELHMYRCSLAILSLLVVPAATPASLSQPQPDPAAAVAPIAGVLRGGVTPYQLALAGGGAGDVATLTGAAAGGAGLSRSALRQQLLGQLPPATQQRLELLESGRKFGLVGPAALAAENDQQRLTLAKQIRLARRAERLAGRAVTANTGVPPEVLTQSEVQAAIARLENVGAINAAFAAQASPPNVGHP